jgi:DNA polymerase-3 subunit epsilon
MTSNVTPTLKQRSIDQARSVLNLDPKPVYMDTETTGLGPTDEIIEISLVDDSGAILLETLVKPTRPIPADATAIHGITNQEVQNERAWPLVWPEVRSLLFGRVVVIYNQEFDLRMLQQSHARYGLTMKERINSFDLLKLYAQYRGEWDPRRRSYRYHSLDAARRQCGLALPNAHRSTADSLLTRALLHHIAGI